MAKFDTLVDTFGGTSLNTGLWTAWATGGPPASSAAESGGALNITLPTTSGASTAAGVQSVSTYDLTGSYAYIDLAGYGGADNGGDRTFFGLILVPLSGYVADNWNSPGYMFWPQQGVLQAIASPGTGFSSGNVVHSATWNTTSQRWLRIRESAGTIFFDTSPDGTTWTNFATHANTYTITGLYAYLIGEQFGASTGSTANLTNFNTTGAPSFSGSPSTGITLGSSVTGSSARPSSPSTGFTLGSSAAGSSVRAGAASTGPVFGSTITGGKSEAQSASTGFTITASAAGAKQASSAPSTGISLGSSAAGASQRAGPASTGLAFGSSVSGGPSGPAGSPSTGFTFGAAASGAKAVSASVTTRLALGSSVAGTSIRHGTAATGFIFGGQAQPAKFPAFVAISDRAPAAAVTDRSACGLAIADKAPGVSIGDE